MLYPLRRKTKSFLFVSLCNFNRKSPNVPESNGDRYWSNPQALDVLTNPTAILLALFSCSCWGTQTCFFFFGFSFFFSTTSKLDPYLTQGLNCKTLCDEYGFHSLNASNMHRAHKHLQKYGCGPCSISLLPTKQTGTPYAIHHTSIYTRTYTRVHTHNTHSQSVKKSKNSFETLQRPLQYHDLQPTKLWRSRLAKTNVKKLQNDGGISPKMAFGCSGQVRIPMWRFLRVFSTNSFAKTVHTSKHADVQQICVGIVCK